jgi:hypothetical protein
LNKRSGDQETRRFLLEKYPPELLIFCEARQVFAPGFEQEIRRSRGCTVLAARFAVRRSSSRTDPGDPGVSSLL